MFSPFLFFDFHNLLNENIKNWCVLNIRYFLMFFLGSYSSLNDKNTPCFTDRCTRMSAHHLRDLQCKRASRSMHSQVSFVSVFSCLFSSSFLKSFFSLLSMLEVPKRAPLDPLLGGKMAPKSLQSGLQDVFNGQNESLQIPSVLQHFCALERVPRRE